MNIFIDTNVILDVLLKREEFYKQSLRVLEVCESGYHKGWISLISVANLNYIGSKLVGKEVTLNAIKVLMTYLEVIDGNKEVVKKALSSNFSDFEDALQYESAIRIDGIEGIITRDVKDYKTSQIPFFSPLEFNLLDF